MKTLILLSVLFLTGCASQCTSHCVFGFGPGNKAFEVMGDHYNTMDPCQHYGKPDGYKLADSVSQTQVNVYTLFVMLTIS
jgi:hypothetical protein